jgi:hypothetical protein
MNKMTLKKIAGFACLICVVTVHPAKAQTHKAKSSATKSTGIMNSMVVLRMAPAGKGNDYIKVVFTTSDRIFRLSPKANPAYAKRLKESMDKHIAVYVKRSSEASDMIQSVIVPGVPGQKKKK